MNSSTARPSYTRSCPRSSRFPRSPTLRTCDTTATSIRSSSPDNTRSAKAWKLVLDALELRVRLALGGHGGGPPAGTFARRVAGRAVVAFGPHDAPAALPVRLYGGAEPQQRLPPLASSLGKNQRSIWRTFLTCFSAYSASSCFLVGSFTVCFPSFVSFVSLVILRVPLPRSPRL
jgi:hypothetical protein